MDQWRVQILKQILILVNPERGPRFVLLGSIIGNFFICDFYIDQGHEEMICLHMISSRIFC